MAWLKRAEGGSPTVSSELPLCPCGTAVTIYTEDPAELVLPATVGFVDDDRIVLSVTGGPALAEAAVVSLRWAVPTGERMVVGTVAAAHRSSWTVQAVGEVVHRQRRAWVRVDTAVPVRVRYPCDDEDADEVWRSGTTVNLSGGGMAAVLDDTVPALLRTAVEVDLPSGTVALTGRVLHHSEAADGYLVRAAFTELPPGAQDRLTRYVFEVEREQLARRSTSRRHLM